MGKKNKAKKKRFPGPGGAQTRPNVNVASESSVLVSTTTSTSGDSRLHDETAIIERLGFLPSSAVGCHVAHDLHESEWILSHEPFSKEGFGLSPDDSVPDLSIDPECGILSFCNDSEQAAKVFYVSVDRAARGLNNVLLERGLSTTTGGEPLRQTDGTCQADTPTGDALEPAGSADQADSLWLTLIVTVPPCTIVDVCELIAEADDFQCGFSTVKVHSHVSERPVDLVINRAPSSVRPGREPVPVYLFPLAGQGPFLCSQQFGGKLTHFYDETYYAIDLQCPLGTLVVAIEDGVVHDIRDGNRVSGICVQNLFHWNSVTLKLKDGNFVDYVHVESGSFKVSPGDKVERGQVICKSGNIGFCPTPHLHLQVQASAGDKERTVPFQLCGASEQRESNHANNNNRNFNHDAATGPFVPTVDRMVEINAGQNRLLEFDTQNYSALQFHRIDLCLSTTESFIPMVPFGFGGSLQPSPAAKGCAARWSARSSVYQPIDMIEVAPSGSSSIGSLRYWTGVASASENLVAEPDSGLVAAESLVLLSNF